MGLRDLSEFPPFLVRSFPSFPFAPRAIGFFPSDLSVLGLDFSTPKYWFLFSPRRRSSPPVRINSGKRSRELRFFYALQLTFPDADKPNFPDWEGITFFCPM